MKRAVLVLVGLVLTVAGGALIAVGVTGILMFGTEGEYRADAGAATTRDGSVALVADVVGIEVAIPAIEQIGTIEFGARATNAESIFIGVADQAAVDDYLFGLPYDVVTRQGDRWDTIPVPGISAQAAEPVGAVDWITYDLGRAPSITLPSASPATVVVMNATGTPNVAATLTVGITSARAFPLSIAAIAIGLVLVVTGVPGMLRWGRKKRGGVAPGAPVDTAVVPTPDANPGGESIQLPRDQGGSVAPAAPEAAPPPVIPPNDPAHGDRADAEQRGTADALSGWFREDTK